MKMKAMRAYMLLLLCALCINAFAEKNALASTSWKLDKVQCRAVATSAEHQAYVDSSLAYLQKTQLSSTASLECEFTETELVSRAKGDAGRWKYKVSGNKLVVDFGGGKLYILDVKSVAPTELILGLDKKRFFISDYAPKDATLPSLVQSLDLEMTLIKKE